MKKLTSILAVALMALGLTTYVVQDTTGNSEIATNESATLACDQCDNPSDRRDPPKLGGIAMNINENVADEFKFMKNENSTLACDQCDNPSDRRDPPKIGIV